VTLGFIQDVGLLLALLEHIVTSTQLDTTYTNNGKECLGGILVFLPGWGDISSLMDMMSVHPEFSGNQKYVVLPLHGGIAPQAQRKVFKRVGPAQRKIVLATNIAETSITIDDIVVVIDSGKYKSKAYDPYTQMSSLQTVWVPQSSAKQRAGRAGRVRPGICFTLMSRSRHEASEPFAKAELLRTPLQELCLQIKLLVQEERIGGDGGAATGASDTISIGDFLDLAPEPPSKMAVRNAILSLQRIGALDLKQHLTRLGLQLARIPMEPSLGRCLVLAVVFGCLDPVLTICCALGYRDPFTIPLDNKAKKVYDQARVDLSNGSNSDHIAVLNAVSGYLQLRNPSQEFGYCRGNFLSHSTMRMIKGMRKQVLDELVRLKLVGDPQRGESRDAAATWAHANRNSWRHAAITTVIACGLYPNVMRRRPGMKNFDAPGQRKCRLNGSSVPNLSGGILSQVDQVRAGRKAERKAKHDGVTSKWITFGEMLKGMRSELVRDASVVSPRSILFGGGSVVAATANAAEDGAEDDEEEGGDGGGGRIGGEDGEEEADTGPRYTTLTIDANTEFHVKEDFAPIMDTLRGCVHGAVALVVWKSEGRKDADLPKGMADCVGNAIDVIVDFVDTDYSRLIYNSTPQRSAPQQGRGNYTRSGGGGSGGGRSRGGGSGGSRGERGGGGQMRTPSQRGGRGSDGRYGGKGGRGGKGRSSNSRR
jgi:hypothetical protein